MKRGRSRAVEFEVRVEKHSESVSGRGVDVPGINVAQTPVTR